jgi:hypothetical protein
MPNWLELPEEIVQHIFEMLDSADVTSAAMISPKWQEVGAIVLVWTYCENHIRREQYRHATCAKVFENRLSNNRYVLSCTIALTYANQTTL